MPQEIATVFIFRSESRPDKEYETLQYTDGATSCNCPGWTYKKKTTSGGERSCKHIRMIDLGTAGVHAVRMVEYSKPAKRTKQRVQTLPIQPVLDYRPNRLMTFED